MGLAGKSNPDVDQVVCYCGTKLGELKNNQWIVYPNPCICPNCGRDNTSRVLDSMVPCGRGGRQ